MSEPRPMAEIRKAFLLLVANAFRRPEARSFASIPARPDVDADLVLGTALDELERLRAFKEYVHKRLDDAGVPVDPPSKHREEGCRIGGRLDVVFEKIAGLEAGFVARVAELESYLRGWEVTAHVTSGMLAEPPAKHVTTESTHSLLDYAASIRAAAFEEAAKVAEDRAKHLRYSATGQDAPAGELELLSVTLRSRALSKTGVGG